MFGSRARDSVVILYRPLHHLWIAPDGPGETHEPAFAAFGQRREPPPATTTDPTIVAPALAALLAEIAPEARIAYPLELGEMRRA